MQRTYNPCPGFPEILGTQGWRFSLEEIIRKQLFIHYFLINYQKYFFHFIYQNFKLNKNKNKWNIKCILVFSLFPTRGWYPGMFCMLRSCLNTGKLTACSVKPRGEREACHTSSSYNTAQCGAHHTTLPLGSSFQVVIVISKFQSGGRFGSCEEIF